MANNSQVIRQLMNLMESVQQPTLLEGWVDSLKGKLDRRLGEKERAEMAAKLTKEFYTWLGHSNRVGDTDDMIRFMATRIGFNNHDIQVVMQNAGLEGADLPDEEPEQDEEPSAPAAPQKKKKPAYDPEEGVPLPDDLENTKLSDYKDVGLEVEKSDGKIEPQEIKDDPRKYTTSNGEWDRQKIRKKLDHMPMGAKLTLGQSTFSRSLGESIMEANEGALPRKVVKQIMDAAAAQVNDEYLYNGPERDKDGMNGTTTRSGRNNARSQDGGEDEGVSPSSPNKPGKAASGQYDAKEMFSILKTDFQKGPAWVESLTRKVMNADTISKMSDADMQDLALLGWALVRARN